MSLEPAWFQWAACRLILPSSGEISRQKSSLHLHYAVLLWWRQDQKLSYCHLQSCRMLPSDKAVFRTRPETPQIAVLSRDNVQSLYNDNVWLSCLETTLQMQLQMSLVPDSSGQLVSSLVVVVVQWNLVIKCWDQQNYLDIRGFCYISDLFITRFHCTTTTTTTTTLLLLLLLLLLLMYYYFSSSQPGPPPLS